eukprot:Blabericola_migrator_1__6554@NODE_3301_length_1878_cov_111_391496_g2062_i0_p1_GENE_NODE_3301_length_1878_cov_111_391496_g2062_i0NODE_3301_length_1878_cov_111_391496_g2062_i0_p1_ORF_typecomplete_len157_score23_66_NODE_3301_length_1878_cov_111_391496_g2062_i013081778
MSASRNDTKVLKAHTKPRPHQRGSRCSQQMAQRIKVKRLLDSYNPAVCRAFSSLMHIYDPNMAKLDVLPETLEAVDLILGDFVDRLSKEFAEQLKDVGPDAGTDPVLGRQCIKGALRQLFNTVSGRSDKGDPEVSPYAACIEAAERLTLFGKGGCL